VLNQNRAKAATAETVSDPRDSEHAGEQLDPILTPADIRDSRFDFRDDGGGVSGPTPATTEREPQDGDRGRIASVANPKTSNGQASRRDTPVTCVACGKRVGRKGRKQKYCSRRCRQRDYWDRRALAKISAVVTHHSAHSTTPRKSSSKFNALQRPKTRRLGFGKAPLNLLGGGEWRWPGKTQLDATTRAKIVCAEIGGTFCRPHADIPEV
jgi:endogenous inhibitor of DNA gyrase (YacG/DUF329 family)